jgi:hypothetical protein
MSDRPPTDGQGKDASPREEMAVHLGTLLEAISEARIQALQMTDERYAELDQAAKSIYGDEIFLTVAAGHEEFVIFKLPSNRSGKLPTLPNGLAPDESERIESLRRELGVWKDRSSRERNKVEQIATALEKSQAKVSELEQHISATASMKRPVRRESDQEPVLEQVKSYGRRRLEEIDGLLRDEPTDGPIHLPSKESQRILELESEVDRLKGRIADYQNLRAQLGQTIQLQAQAMETLGLSLQ